MSPTDQAPAGSRRGRSTPRDTLRYFLLSRLLVWGVGCLAVVALGRDAANVAAFDPRGLSTSLGAVGNVLAAPAVRWDATWYLQIAAHGYHSVQDAGFFPLYPLLIGVGSVLTGSQVLAGVLISLVALFIGLETIRRLTELELGPATARATVLLIAFAPLAVFQSAVYTEALFLALSAGTFYAARGGRWWAAGVLGGLAAASRVGGALLLAPVLLLFLYGPRVDADPRPVRAWWRPRYRLTAHILWAALIPAGAAAFSLYLSWHGLGLAGSLRAQQHFWAHRLVFPLRGAWNGATAAWHQLRLELGGAAPRMDQSDAILQFVALVAAVVALVGVFRRLPKAYGVYAAVGILQVLSVPTAGDPLKGFDRYASMCFPLFMWAAAWGTERGIARRLAIASAIPLALVSIQFATWHWVGGSSL